MYNEVIEKLRKQITEDFGPKCKDFSVFCANCIAWRAFGDLQELYEPVESVEVEV